VGEESWLSLTGSVEPSPRFGGLASQSFELLHRVEPASNPGVDGLGETGQVVALRRLRCQSLICLPIAFFALGLMAGEKLTKKPRRPRARRPRKV